MPGRSSETLPVAEVQKQLATVPMFNSLPKRELKRLAARTKQRNFRKGQVLAREGEVGGALFVIASGTVDITAHGTHVRFAGPGDVIGEISMLDRQPRSASMIAENDVVALTMTSTTFMNLLAESPSIARGVIENLATRLRASTRLL